MTAITNASTPVQPASGSLEHLSDAELLAGTRSLVGRSNQLLAALLAHLGEVEARGVHRTRACSSLYTYAFTNFAYPRTRPSAALPRPVPTRPALSGSASGVGEG